jgi:hypothetical protein
MGAIFLVSLPISNRGGADDVRTFPSTALCGLKTLAIGTSSLGVPRPDSAAVAGESKR